MPSRPRFAIALATAALLLAQPLLAFDSPLSEEAVREAYFLGQRHDESFVHALDKYTTYLDAPETGPHIASVTFFTPFALLVQSSSQHATGYSAQQAAIDHRHQKETVKIIVDIRLTASYGPYTVRRTGTRSDSPQGFVPRPYDFWKEFNVRVISGDLPMSAAGDDSADAKEIRPISSDGQPNMLCSEDGGCSLSGATIEFEFLAEDFTSGSATVIVTPPEGDPVSVTFDLADLR
jgi:hypothetical protein